MSNHDDHYQKFNALLGVDSMEIIESIGDRDELTTKQITNLQFLLKYCLRLGLKRTIPQDIDKIYNFAHRLKYGVWAKDND